MLREANRGWAWTGLLFLVLSGCPSPELTVGGTISGLDGTLQLGLAGQLFAVVQNGNYHFPTTLAAGDSYQVTIQVQPANQVCTVANASGVMGQAAVTNVDVSCVTYDPNSTYTVQVQVSGLSGTLVLVNNGIDPLTVSTNGPHTFAAPINGGSFYNVTVQSEPAGVACVIENGSGQVSNANITNITVTCSPGYIVSGIATYDWVPAKDTTQGGVRLDYAAKVPKPIRRAIVRAVNASTKAQIAEGRTKDDGTYSLSVPNGTAVNIWVEAHLLAAAYVKDGIEPERCGGGGWDIDVVENSNAQEPRYVLKGTATYSTATGSANLNAPLAFNGTSYTNRTAAPFAILDTALAEIELVCQGSPAVVLPRLRVGWSANNTTDGSTSIGTSYYVRDSTGLSRLYILGEDGTDTDEYDDHVIAHETGHFIEDRLYRGDSVGGHHSSGDILHPSVAFSEGYGNAISGMTFNDPVYVDTNGTAQADGFDVDVSWAPTNNDRGIYSENSAQYFLWSLYENRDVPVNSGSFDRLHVALQDQRTTPALTSLHTFAAYYYSHFGASAEGLHDLWSVDLNALWDALCVGACAPSGTALDLFDADNDIGTHYAATRVYPPGGGGTSRDAEFWRLYRVIASGTTVGNNHDTAVGYGSAPANKWGYLRTYRFVGTGGQVTIQARLQGSYPSTCNTAGDVLDMYILAPSADGSRSYAFSDTAETGPTAGCPSVHFTATNGVLYDVVVGGLQNSPSWDMVVSP